MDNFETILFELNSGVAKITLNRPDAANGMNMTMGRELMEAAIRCEDDTSIRAIVITGSGRMFSAGGDLKSLAAYGDQMSVKLKELTTYLHAAITCFSRMNAPVVIAVNGTAAGAGFSLAVAGDMVLAAESAKFTMAYTAAGLAPDVGASHYLVRLIGLRKTQDLMLTNRLLTAAQAQEWGAISQVVPNDELQSAAMELATKLASGPTAAFGTVKRLLRSSFSTALETQLDSEANGIAAMAKTEDGKEGVLAFLEKRAAVFKGH